MTMSVNVAHHGPDAYTTLVVIEDRTYDVANERMTDNWHEADRFTLAAGEHRTVYLHSSCRLRVEEVQGE